MIDVDKVDSLFGVDEPFKAPDALMKILFERVKRENLFRQWLEMDSNLQEDQFRAYFQSEQAQRSRLKQDFTPTSITGLAGKLTDGGGMVFDPAAGTGGLIISRWWQDCVKNMPWQYKPSQHMYAAWELSEAAIPFLLFNMLIRGMNAVIINGDTLEQSARNVFFVQNDQDDPLAFSSLNVMPRSKDLQDYLNISKWDGKPIQDHIESKNYPTWMQIQRINVNKRMKQGELL